MWINDHIPLVSEMPHGGFKQSGYGKDLSIYALEDYTRVKHVMVNLEPENSFLTAWLVEAPRAQVWWVIHEAEGGRSGGAASCA